MSSRYVLVTATSGRQVTGPGTTRMTTTTGCREPGFSLLKSVSSGLRVIGLGVAVVLFSMKAIGARWLASTVELITGSDTSAAAMRGADGRVAASITTPPSIASM